MFDLFEAKRAKREGTRKIKKSLKNTKNRISAVVHSPRWRVETQAEAVMDRDAIEYTRQHYDAHANKLSTAEVQRDQENE